MTSDLCAADINLKVLMNAIALAFRSEPAKRDAILQLVADIRSDLKLRPFISPHLTPSPEPAGTMLSPMPETAPTDACLPIEFETTKILVTRIMESVWDIRAMIKKAQASIDESRPLIQAPSLELLSSVSFTPNHSGAVQPVATAPDRIQGRYRQTHH